VQSLLAYLILHRARRHPRAVLATVIAPDVAEARARRGLSQSLWLIRKALPGFLQVDNDTIGISPCVALWADVLEFERLTTPHLGRLPTPDHTSQAHADLHHAIELYRGDLLEGIFDDWIITEQERLHERYLQALERLAALEKLAGHFQEALELSITLTQADPYHEQAHREVMALYARLDRRDAALRQFAICRQILRDELDTVPDPSTVALANTIARSSDHPPGIPPLGRRPAPVCSDEVSSSFVPFVGRQRERAYVLMQLEAIYHRGSSQILLEGEVGLGKTRLLQEVAQDAEWRGAQVIWVQGNAQWVASPYRLLASALDKALTPVLAQLMASLLDQAYLCALKLLMPQLCGLASPPRQLAAEQERETPAEALAQLLGVWASVRPLVVIFEDVYRFDPEILDLLRHLAPITSRPGLAIIASYRDAEAQASPRLCEALAALASSSHTTHLILTGLEVAATEDLIRGALGGMAALPWLAACLQRETGGNPLFVLGAVQVLRERGLLWTDTAGAWHTALDGQKMDHFEVPLPPVVHHALAQHLSLMPAQLHQVLCAAAILGQWADARVLASVCATEGAALTTCVMTLIRRGLLAESASAYELASEVRQFVLGELALSEQVRLHTSAANAFEQWHPEQVETIARHYAAAQIWDRAIYYYRLAGQRAVATGDYAAVARYFSQALTLVEHLPLSDEEHFDLLAEHEAASAAIGDRAGQAADLAAMASLAAGDPRRLEIYHARHAEFLAATLSPASSRMAESAKETNQLRCVAIRLPRAAVPTGRPLHDDEWIEVQWTVAELYDDAVPDKMERRHRRLQGLLKQAQTQGAAPTIDDLAAALRVSRATIKRDLAALRHSGCPVATRGSRRTGLPRPQSSAAQK
jgi:DNA-binding SARP family transcriptional activator/biotin operon repressor